MPWCIERNWNGVFWYKEKNWLKDWPKLSINAVLKILLKLVLSNEILADVSLLQTNIFMNHYYSSYYTNLTFSPPSPPPPSSFTGGFNLEVQCVLNQDKKVIHTCSILALIYLAVRLLGMTPLVPNPYPTPFAPLPPLRRHLCHALTRLSSRPVSLSALVRNQ